MVRVSQPVLGLLPAEACSVGASAGLVEGPDGGVVFVFGLATFSYAASDEVGRRLAAVQLVAMKISSSREVAGAFGPTAHAERRGQRSARRAGRLANRQRRRAGHRGERAGELVVLAAPVPRTADRVAARFGELVEAPVVLTEGAHLPLVGLLLALPALEMTGLLDVATATFGSMSK